MGKLNFNRKVYDRVRKMDSRQMRDYVTEIWMQGYQSGQSDTIKEPPNLSGLEEELIKIRGIGGAKARMVTEVVKSYLDGQPSSPGEAI